MSAVPEKWRHRFAIAVVCALGIVLGAAPKPAWAHAVLVSSTPPANGTVTTQEFTVQLRYDSRVDSRRSTLSMLEPDGKTEALSILPQSAPNLLSAKVLLPEKGSYAIRWQALASDGHITRGEVPFLVR